MRYKTRQSLSEEVTTNIIKDYKEKKIRVIDIMQKYDISQSLLYGIIKKNKIESRTYETSTENMIVTGGFDVDRFKKEMYESHEDFN